MNLDHSPTRSQLLPIKFLLAKHGAVGYSVLWRIEEILLLQGEEFREKLIDIIQNDLFVEVDKINSIINILIDQDLLQEKDGIINSENISRQKRKAESISRSRSMAGKAGRAKYTGEVPEQPAGTIPPVKIPTTRKKFVPPTAIEIEEYALSRGFKLDGKFIIDWYTKSDWRDSNNKKVQNWKLKILQVWCKDENKIKKGTRKDIFPDEGQDN